jgi:RND family efflux transporter MFP subunit
MKSRIFWIALLVAVLGTIGWRVSAVRRANQKAPETSAAVALIRVATVARADIAERVAFTGTVRPKNEVDVFPKVAGRIETLAADVGDRVRAGEVIATIEHKEIAWQAKAAQAALEVARANLSGAKLEWNRTQALHKGGAAPQAQLDAAKMRHDLAEAQTAQAEAAAGLALQQLENSRITAPFSGTLTRRPVNIGSQVGPHSVWFTLQDVASLKLEASVDASSFVRLARGAQAQVSVDVLPGELFPGRVALLSPTLDSQTRRAQVQIEIDNTRGKLMPNMFASASVVVGHLQGVLVLPKEAILEAAGGPVAYRVMGGHVESVKPRLGASDGDRVVIAEGLSEGDDVAVTSLGNLADGAAVKVATPTPGALTRAPNP